MRVLPSPVAGVTVHGHGSPEFEQALPEILGTAPRELLRAALPYSVIVLNRGERTISFLGVRFDMISAGRKQYSVVHYADTLRNPAKSDFRPSTGRFICAEPEYTSLVLRGDVAPKTRGRMNLENLRQMLDMRASIDCVAFADGQFVGPDSQRSFDRLVREREVELKFLDRLFDTPELEKLLYAAVEDPEERAIRNVARKVLEGFVSGGPAEAITRAQAHRCRIPLFR